MRNTATAYNLAQFSPQEQRGTQVRVVRAPKKKKNVMRAFKVKCVMYCAALMVLMAGTVLSQQQLTAVESQIAMAEEEIVQMESKNTYLNYQVGSAVSLKNLENYAKNELGMVMAGPGQVEYVDLSDGNKIISEASGKRGLQEFWSSMAQFFFGK